MIDLEYVIALTLALFSISIMGVLTRRNVIIVFMSVEIMLNSVNLLFIAFAKMRQDIAGEIFVFFCNGRGGGRSRYRLGLSDFFIQKLRYSGSAKNQRAEKLKE